MGRPVPAANGKGSGAVCRYAPAVRSGCEFPPRSSEDASLSLNVSYFFFCRKLTFFVSGRISMQADRSSDYTNRIREECSRMNYNMIMVVMRSQRADTYGAIKKLTCADIGIPSQVRTSFFFYPRSTSSRIFLF